jgi:hypothetical protein
MFREEVKRRRRQLRELCRAVRVDNIPELQELLCAMVLAECVYKVRSRLRRSPVPRSVPLIRSVPGGLVCLPSHFRVLVTS